jgi:hypothetical protein
MEIGEMEGLVSGNDLSSFYFRPRWGSCFVRGFQGLTLLAMNGCPLGVQAEFAGRFLRRVNIECF